MLDAASALAQNRLTRGHHAVCYTIKFGYRQAMRTRCPRYSTRRNLVEDGAGPGTGFARTWALLPSGQFPYDQLN